MERPLIFTDIGDTMEAALQRTGEESAIQKEKKSSEAEKEKFLQEQEQNHTRGSLSTIILDVKIHRI